eukprot:TRINITY_DN3776_c0_g1_i1.p1 TRINITY_DN3776_c0_g1~~TRINITY_DN3776_c0_g1_i1.p1  ORF type:complete len:250 (-),score=45.48 TRINITY_DN3776_c0_g1_i1:202-951(-)
MAPRSLVSNMAAEKESFKWSQSLRSALGSCRKLRISRHGESLYNVAGLIGGNPELSPFGHRYAHSLATKVNNSMPQDDLKIWTSELIRTQQTARFLRGTLKIHPELNEIHSGDHDSMTYEEIAKDYPSEYTARDNNKLTYRYPNGESYIDVCRRIDRILSQIDGSDNLLIVSHQAVIRCILGAVLEANLEEMPFIKVPLHTLIEIDFHEDGKRPTLNYIPLNIETSSTAREQPSRPLKIPNDSSAIAAH